MTPAPQRVVVTGLGTISPLGDSREATWRKLVAGTSGIDTISHFDASRHACRIAGEVRTFDPLAHMERKLARRTGRYAQFAIAAAREAIAHSALDLAVEDPERIASVVGSAIGDFPLLEEQMRVFFGQGPGHVNPFTVPRVSSNMAAANVALVNGLTGPSFGVASACATGAHAIASAWMLLRAGLADVALAGGTEAAITPSFVDAYSAMGALSLRDGDPAGASRPFDRDRAGFVLAEGCGMVVLETLEHALRRRAPVLAELSGVGMASEAHHITASHPAGRGAARAMALALRAAGLVPADVDYINAHGTGTLLNDVAETVAIKSVFGTHAYRLPISSTKSMLGHAIAAAGAIEAMISVMSITDNVVPPTINLDDPDPECDLDYVPHVGRAQALRVVMSNSFAFGGQMCVLVFERFEATKAVRSGE